MNVVDSSKSRVTPRLHPPDQSPTKRGSVWIRPTDTARCEGRELTFNGIHLLTVQGTLRQNLGVLAGVGDGASTGDRNKMRAVRQKPIQRAGAELRACSGGGT